MLHLLAPARFGGLESVVISLTPALEALGMRVTVALVVTPEENGDVHPVARALAHSSVNVETLVLRAREYREETRRVRAILERESVDVIHTHGYRPDVLDAPVARRMGIATVSTAHGLIGGSFKGRMYERLQRRAWRRFDAVVAVSKQLADRIVGSGVADERVHLLPNAWSRRGPGKDRVRARAELGLPPSVPVVGWIGRMSREKAPDVMIRAAARVRTSDVVFSMIGDGPDREACQALAAESGIADRVHWHGSVPDAGGLLAAYDAVVLSSWTEGTPIVLLEAMGSGVPVVSTAVGGIPDVVSADEEALLCNPGDVAAIAEAIDRTLGDRQQARRRADAAKQRLERDFSVTRWARRHAELYRSVAGRS